MSKELSTYQQQAYDFVREQIINLVYKPGEYITDTQIAEKLSISRTPVREAFQRLEKEGLLVYEAHKGWRVYSLDLQDIYEIFDLKIAIEGMVVKKAAACRDENLKSELKEALATMRSASKAEDSDQWLKADVRLHNILFIMANNVRAERYIASLNDQWHRLRLGYVALQGRTRKSVNEHDLFVESVLAHRPDEAEQRMQSHLTSVRDDLIQLVEKILMPYTNQGF